MLHMCECVYIHPSCMCRCQRRMPGAFSCNSVSYYLMTGSLAGWKLTILDPPVPILPLLQVGAAMPGFLFICEC